MPRKKRKVLGVTGHRPDKLDDFGDAYEMRSPIQDWCRMEFRKVLEEERPDVVISGFALGWDQWCAAEALAYGAKLWAYIPFEGQDDRWWGESKTHYRELLTKASVVRFISSPGYAAWKMQARNIAVVDDCSIICGLWNGSDGGTKNCLDYATKKKRRTILIDPTPGLALIEKETRELSARSAREGGWYTYLGGLRWQYKPLTKAASPLLCPNCQMSPCDASCIPF